MRIAAITLLLILAACAGRTETGGGSSVTGDQMGGKVPYAEGNMPAAMTAARSHCAQFGKKAQLTQMVPQSEGGILGFECR
jgi:hypothetical protein